MKKTDYEKIAKTYDSSRPLSEQNLDVWLRLIAGKVGSLEKVKLLDLGCGTGRFTIPLATRLGYSVTGVDASEEMIQEAKTKKDAGLVTWDVQDATSLTFPDESFNAIFMSHLLHHVEDKLQVLKECYRVLKPRGVYMNRHVPLEDLDNPDHVFFPEAYEIDKKRYVTKKQIEDWLKQVGFSKVTSETILQQSHTTSEERYRALSMKSVSTLTLISESAFKKGLEALREYITKNPNDHWLITDKLTLTTGYKTD